MNTIFVDPAGNAGFKQPKPKAPIPIVGPTKAIISGGLIDIPDEVGAAGIVFINELIHDATWDTQKRIAP